MRFGFSKRDKTGAFTLIELMIVLVLIVILSAVIIPEMKGTYGDALLRSTSRELANAFDIASSRAVSLNQLHRVRLEPETRRYLIEQRIRETDAGDEFAPLKDVPESEGTLDKRISIQVRTAGETLTTDMTGQAPPSDESNFTQPIDAISFYSDGTADPAEVLLRDKDGFRLALRINPITARVRVIELERE